MTLTESPYVWAESSQAHEANLVGKLQNRPDSPVADTRGQINERA